jgi:hypothetical protein
LDYIITNGRQYIRLNENGAPVSCAKPAAERFTQYKAENIVKSLPKSLQKFHFKVQPVPEEGSKIDEYAIQATYKKPLDEESKAVLENLDDFYEDYRESSDKDNIHAYTQRTYIEDNIDDVPAMLREMIIFVSQMDNFIQNMKYTIREYDLKILDVRHFIRNNGTRLGVVHMAKVGYLWQDFERKRAKCKIAMNCCLVFQNHLERLKNENYINIIDEISGSEYRYRRLDEDAINTLIGRNIKNDEVGESGD